MFNKKKLLSILNGKKLGFRNLARKMNVPIPKNRDFSFFLRDLIRTSDIMLSNDNLYYIPEVIGTGTGNIKIHTKGFGFIDFDDGTSCFIPRESTNTSLNGDEVEYEMYHGDTEGRKLCSVVNVVKRVKTEFVVRVTKNKWAKIEPFDKSIVGKIQLRNNNEEYPVNTFLKVKIIEVKNRTFFVDVVSVLGVKDDISLDIDILIAESGISTFFADAVIEQTKLIPETIDDELTTNRVDLRENCIVTIDGDDTKDFDDAIEISKLNNGNYELGVHIADVTHYVKEFSAIDDEAKTRGTSVYLADRVIPMLPVELSNGICSLNPKVDRFVISCVMEIDGKGKTVNTKIFPAIIHSKARLTYKQVNNYYHNKDQSDMEQEVLQTLDLSLELTKLIRTQKEKEGYIDFEIDEAKIIIGDDGETIDIQKRERDISEMMIEDFMVRANEEVAKFVTENELAFIYRVHDCPNAEKLDLLQSVMNALEIDVKIPHSGEPIDYANAIKVIKSNRFDNFIKIMLLRTMSKAIYSRENIGHFGLASECYTHFTSPIRRYPDLMVHRMLRTYFFDDDKTKSDHFANILPGIAKANSDSEVKAVELERKVADMKKAEFYENFIGHEMKSQIVTVAKFGFFVEFENQVSALVHVSTLSDNADFEVSSDNLSMSNGVTTYNIGDIIDVTIGEVDATEGKISAIVSSQYQSWKTGIELRKTKFSKR